MLMAKFRGLLMYRDDLYSQKGVIKSASVSLEGKLAPFALHLYLEELAIFEEVTVFYNELRCLLERTAPCHRFKRDSRMSNHDLVQ